MTKLPMSNIRGIVLGVVHYLTIIRRLCLVSSSSNRKKLVLLLNLLDLVYSCLQFFVWVDYYLRIAVFVQFCFL